MPLTVGAEHMNCAVTKVRRCAPMHSHAAQFVLTHYKFLLFIFSFLSGLSGPQSGDQMVGPDKEKIKRNPWNGVAAGWRTDKERIASQSTDSHFFCICWDRTSFQLRAYAWLNKSVLSNKFKKWRDLRACARFFVPSTDGRAWSACCLWQSSVMEQEKECASALTDQRLVGQEKKCTRTFLGAQFSERKSKIKGNVTSIHIFDQMLAVSSFSSLFLYLCFCGYGHIKWTKFTALPVWWAIHRKVTRCHRYASLRSLRCAALYVAIA